MALNSVLSARSLALAGAVLLLASAGSRAQMVGGGVGGFQAVQSAQAQAQAQPNSAYSNPYSNNGVAQPRINSQGDPYAAVSGQGAATGLYVTPMGYAAPATPSAGVAAQSAQSGTPAYGAAGEPFAAPNYSVQAQPSGGPFAAAQAYPPPYAPQPYAPQPQYAQPQYAQPMPQYAQPMPQYAQPQYMPQAQPQYAQPQPVQPAPAAGAATPVAMAPNNNLIASPYANARAATTPGAPMMEGGYTLGPGDKVRLTVFGETDLSGEYQLDGNGNIRLPLAGIVHAGGYTAQGLEAAIYGALVPNYLRNPRLNVEILVYRPIYVVGQVQKPGQYAYVNDMTMMNAIGLAGGFTPQAKESTVYVRRAGEVKEEQVSTAQPLLIRPGDTIRVDTTLFWDAMNMFAPLSGPAYLASSTIH